MAPLAPSCEKGPPSLEPMTMGSTPRIPVSRRAPRRGPLFSGGGLRAGPRVERQALRHQSSLPAHGMVAMKVPIALSTVTSAMGEWQGPHLQRATERSTHLQEGPWSAQDRSQRPIPAAPGLGRRPARCVRQGASVDLLGAAWDLPASRCVASPSRPHSHQQDPWSAQDSIATGAGLAHGRGGAPGFDCQGCSSSACRRRTPCRTFP